MKPGLTAEDLRLTHKYTLTAAECDARGTISPALMTERIIEVATQHANLLGIGYTDLSQHGIGWVLSRMSLRMQRWPRFNHSFALHTWIEDVNRLYSTRCMRITGEGGDTIGEARTIWAAINVADRTPADISILGLDNLVIGADGITVPRPGRIPPCPAENVRGSYTWRYSDIDINRHVNSVRYIETMLDIWPLEHYDTHRISHIDIIYQHECLYGQTVAIAARDIAVTARDTSAITTAEATTHDTPQAQIGEQASDVELLREGKRVCAAHIVWKEG